MRSVLVLYTVEPLNCGGELIITSVDHSFIKVLNGMFLHYTPLINSFNIYFPTDPLSYSATLRKTHLPVTDLRYLNQEGQSELGTIG